MRHLPQSLVVLLLFAGGLAATSPQPPPFFPLEELRPGMTGIGRTVFSGDTIEEFKVHIIGLLRNVMGPKRDLVLARLEGGPLATTGVMQGMSGSPVYIDGRLLGAVSYSLGSFPREPLAGITPIGEMVDAVNSAGARTTAGISVSPTATPAEAYTALSRIATQIAAPLGRLPGDTRIVGPAAIADMAPALRPIGAAMVLSGFDPSVDREIRQALSMTNAGQTVGAAASTPPPGGLRPGDAVGMSLIHGDFEMGATGTVTLVDGARVYAFGHPFLNLGPTSFAMTRARVHGVLPSLDTSMKIATLGPVIGTMSQDRATAVGGTLGAAPSELEVNVTLNSLRAPERKFTFHVLRDQLLTPLFSYVAVLNSLVSYERQAGALTVSATGSISFGKDGQVEIDDIFTGDTTVALTSAGVTSAVAAAATNEFRATLPEKMDVTLHVGERQASTSIERAWLDTTRPAPGATHTLNVLLRNYRGDTETVSLPVVMPAQASGPLTLLVSDAATLAGLEQRDLKPGKPSTWPALLAQMNSVRRNNRLYVRLISSTAGTVVSGETLPALPASVRSVLDEDKTVATAPVAKTVIGAWERRLDRAVRGSRELTVTLTPRN
jgi:hypothetical protein